MTRFPPPPPDECHGSCRPWGWRSRRPRHTPPLPHPARIASIWEESFLETEETPLKLKQVTNRIPWSRLIKTENIEDHANYVIQRQRWWNCDASSQKTAITQRFNSLMDATTRRDAINQSIAPISINQSINNTKTNKQTIQSIDQQFIRATAVEIGKPFAAVPNQEAPIFIQPTQMS